MKINTIDLDEEQELFLENMVEDFEKFDNGYKNQKRMRDAVLAEISKILNPNTLPGTHNYAVKDRLLKLTQGINYKLDKEVADSMHVLSEEELECVTLVPKLSVAAYKSLNRDNTCNGELEEFITTTEAMPTLKIE